MAAGAAGAITRADSDQQTGRHERCEPRIDLQSRPCAERHEDERRDDQPDDERDAPGDIATNRFQQSASTPLMPAMRPFSNTNIAVAMPISSPPATADPGVKAFQSTDIG